MNGSRGKAYFKPMEGVHLIESDSLYD